MSTSSREYLIVLEKAGKNYGAYAPDLPGCVATGRTRREAETNMRGAIAMHLEGMREDGLRPPRADARASHVSASLRVEGRWATKPGAKAGRRGATAKRSPLRRSGSPS